MAQCTGRSLCLLTLALCAAVARAQQDVETASVVVDAPVASKIVAAETAQQKILSSADFPATPANRPPLWPFRSLSDAQEVTCEVNDLGVQFVKVVHKPLKGVTPEMMTWLYENLEGVSTHPVTKKVYPNFLLFHPRDHIKHTASRHPLAKGVSMNFVEFPLTGCQSNSAPGAKAVWSCPSKGGNPGVTKSTPAEVWKGYSQTNGTMNIAKTSDKEVQWNIKGCNEKGQCASVIKFSHKWSPAGGAKAAKGKAPPSPSDGLELTSSYQIGLNMGLARNINPRITRAWRNGEDQNLKCWRAALHTIEEYGGLEHWLPQAFKEAQAKRG